MIVSYGQRRHGVFLGFFMSVILILAWTDQASVSSFAPRTNKTMSVMFQNAKHQDIYNKAIKKSTDARYDDPLLDTAKTSIVEFEINNLDGQEGKKGKIRILLRPDWAPLGVQRFEELVKDGFYNNCRFFRVLPNYIAQVGMNGNPSINRRWKPLAIKDDPVTVSNTYGTVVFATAGPNTRTTQIFFNTNLEGNPDLDERGFAPFGEVLEEDMELIANQLYSGYDGEGPPNGNGPSQSRIREEGNAYLESSFQKLSYISNVKYDFIDD